MYLILMGGFLGAGKTTAINHAAALLQGRAHQVSVITNDQGSQLVDTKFAEGNGYNVSEVTGGCFCCNFDKLEQLVSAIMSGHGSEIILAESVGSCTDLVATVIKPMKREHKNIRISLSVFVDAPAMWAQWQAHKYIYKPTIEYIFEKQLEEADIIVLNKVDLMSQQNLQKLMDAIKDKYPAKEVASQNSNDSNDIERWLQLVLKGIEPHRDSLLIDYEAYAAGEAQLAWLDGEINIRGPHSVVVANRFIKSIKNKIDENEWPIGHIKLLYKSSEGLQKVSITAVTSPNMKLFVGDSEQVMLLLNARVQCEPSQLYHLLQNTIAEMNEESATHLRMMNIDYFKPGYPRPTHRIA